MNVVGYRWCHTRSYADLKAKRWMATIQSVDSISLLTKTNFASQHEHILYEGQTIYDGQTIRTMGENVSSATASTKTRVSPQEN